MDITTHPCNNFYKFTCGNYAKQRNKPVLTSQDEEYQLAQQKYLKLIKSSNHNSKLLNNMDKYHKICFAAGEKNANSTTELIFFL